MTDQDILAIIAQGIVDGTDLDCTAETQAREVLRQLRAAGVIVGTDWTPPQDRHDGYRCLCGFGNDEWRTGIWQTYTGGGGDWHDIDGRRLNNPTSFFTLPENS